MARKAKNLYCLAFKENFADPALADTSCLTYDRHSVNMWYVNEKMNEQDTDSRSLDMLCHFTDDTGTRLSWVTQCIDAYDSDRSLSTGLSRLKLAAPSHRAGSRALPPRPGEHVHARMCVCA